MIDDKKIEEATEYQLDKLGSYGLNEDEIGRIGSLVLYREEDIKDSFKAGIDWLLNNLWHPASEEPKHDKQITYVQGNGIAKTIILNEEADKFNRTPSQIWHNICKNYKVVSWLYIDDLLPKKGGNQ